MSAPIAQAGARAVTAATARVRGRRRAAATAANRRLRNLVARLHACLGSLTPQSRRLLTLRTGLGSSAPLSARAVARIMHVSTRREALLEQVSVITLRIAALSGCAASPIPSTVPPTLDQLAATAPSLPGAVSSGGTSGIPTAAPTAGSSRTVRVRRAPSRVKAVHAGSAQGSPAPPRQSYERASTSGGELPVVAIALIALLLAAPVLVWPPSRRRLLAAPALLAAASASERRSKPSPRSSAPSLARPPRTSAENRHDAEAANPASARWLPPAPAAPKRPSSGSDPTAAPVSVPSRPSPPSAPVNTPSPPSAPSAQWVEPPARPQGREWLREHATQTALVVTAIGGMIARSLGRSRRRR